ncbi:MAG: ATP-binding protein [Betaproteobacteria bacterium]
MDGQQGRLGPSLQGRLSLWLGLLIFASAIAAAVFSFQAAFSEAIELQDEQLRQLAGLIDRQHKPSIDFGSEGDPNDDDFESRIVVLQLPLRSHGTVNRGQLTGLSAQIPDGIQTVRPGKLAWRIYVKTLGSGVRVAIAQRAAVRNEVARAGALRSLLPLLLLIPLLLLLVRVLVRRMFRPLKVLASELDRRAEDDTQAISVAQVPAEIQPFVIAINHQLARVALTMAQQRRFVADAAHELRSPLTALSLQAERLDGAEMSQEARARLASLRSGIRRSQNLVMQMLMLARVQQTDGTPVRPISLQKVLRGVLEDLYPLAEARHIDLGVEGDADAQVQASEVDLTILVKNLVDNAIRHTPAHGRIDLSVRQAGQTTVLCVSDTGPGIAEGERARVFDAFYRVTPDQDSGAGLGLSIVKAIVGRLHAHVELAYTDPPAHSGLIVRVMFPMAHNADQVPHDAHP